MREFKETVSLLLHIPTHYWYARNHWKLSRGHSLWRCVRWVAGVTLTHFTWIAPAYRPLLGLRINHYKRWQWYM